MEILEYRGVEGLVAAEILADDNDEGNDHGYKTGEVFQIAGVAEIQRTTDSSQAAHYYDNYAAIVVTNESSDTVTISASAIPLDVLGKISGQYYDAETGSLIEGKRDLKYFAIGYKTKKTNGDEMYVWRYKGTFAIPDQTNHTEDDSTDANGQELVYTGISTTHKFTKTGKGAKAMVVDASKELADVSSFFSTVTTPDTLDASSDFTLTITQAEGTTVTVIRDGVVLETGAGLREDDELTVYLTGGTMTINGEAATNGAEVTVSANVTIISST